MHRFVLTLGAGALFLSLASCGGSSGGGTDPNLSALLLAQNPTPEAEEVAAAVALQAASDDDAITATMQAFEAMDQSVQMGVEGLMAGANSGGGVSTIGGGFTALALPLPAPAGGRTYGGLAFEETEEFMIDFDEIVGGEDSHPYTAGIVTFSATAIGEIEGTFGDYFGSVDYDAQLEANTDVVTIGDDGGSVTWIEGTTFDLAAVIDWTWADDNHRGHSIAWALERNAMPLRVIHPDGAVWTGAVTMLVEGTEELSVIGGAQSLVKKDWGTRTVVWTDEFGNQFTVTWVKAMDGTLTFTVNERSYGPYSDAEATAAYGFKS